MASRTIQLRGDHRELHSFFKGLLKNINFVIIHEEHRDDGFLVVAVNKKRMSQLTVEMMSLIGGFIPRNRIGIELFAHEREDVLTVELKCSPYISSLDMEAAIESQEELDRCRRQIEFFEEKILEGFKKDTYGL